jgi:tetratricopeptide (TPR) repeat protein
MVSIRRPTEVGTSTLAFYIVSEPEAEGITIKHRMKRQIRTDKRKKTITSILNDKRLNQTQKTGKLMPVIQEMTDMDSELLERINAKLKGPYGSEFLLTHGDFLSLIPFYSFLNQKFPDSAEILLSLGDLLLLNQQYRSAFDAFNKAFDTKPLLIFKAPGELFDELNKYGSDSQKIDYQISLVRALILDGELVEARDEYQELIQMYDDDHEMIKKCLQEKKIKAELSRLTEG